MWAMLKSSGDVDAHPHLARHQRAVGQLAVKGRDLEPCAPFRQLALEELTPRPEAEPPKLCGREARDQDLSRDRAWRMLLDEQQRMHSWRSNSSWSSCSLGTSSSTAWRPAVESRS
jgi:hypothetical protein